MPTLNPETRTGARHPKNCRHIPRVGIGPHLCVDVVGFAYVAFVIDAYARRILGWRVAATMATSMVLDAIEQAIWTRQHEGVFDLTSKRLCT